MGFLFVAQTTPGSSGPYVLTNHVGDVVINGSLTVNTLIATNTVSTGDNMIVLNDDVTGAPSEDAGIEINRGTSTDARLMWNETKDRWEAGLVGSLSNIILDSDFVAKGDLLTRSSSAATILPIGTDGQILTADSAQTLGMKWAAAPAGYTDEQAQDAVGNILTDTASIDFTYNDAGNTISAVVLPAGVSHNSLANLTTGDPHTQYTLLAGRSGGQTIFGQPSNIGSHFIKLQSNSTDENTGNIRFGTTLAIANSNSSTVATLGATNTCTDLFILNTATGTTVNNSASIKIHTGNSGPTGNTNSGDILLQTGLNNASGTIGSIKFTTGAFSERAIVKSTEFVVNDPGNDYDFRVEGDTDANLIFADASTDRVGIGTNAPDASLHVVGNITSPGSANGSEKFGLGATADGDFSTALGNSANASDLDTTAIGFLAQAVANGSTAVGSNASAAAFGTALGRNASALGDSSTAVGDSAQANLMNGTAVGNGANAADEDATAIGHNASGSISSVAIGSGASANNFAVAIGPGAQAFDTSCLAIGPGAICANGVAIGPSATVDQGVLVGVNATIGSSSACVAMGSSVSIGDSGEDDFLFGDGVGAGDGAERNILIGKNINSSLNDVIALGFAVTVASDGIIALGSNRDTGTPISKMYLGYGEYINGGTPQADFYISPTYIQDLTDNVGTNLNIDGGNGTGTAGGGKVILRTTTPDGSSGDAPLTYANRLTVYNTGEVEIANALALKSSSDESITADNQAITVGSRSHIVISSNNAVAVNRTFTLSNGLRDGQMLILEWSGTNAGELAAASNRKMTATWLPTQYDTISFMWSSNASAWLELCRSVNA